MAKTKRRQRGEAEIANSIATRRNQYLGAVRAREKEAARLAKAVNTDRTAIVRAEEKISQRKKAVAAAEAALEKQRRGFKKTETAAGEAKAALAQARTELEEFDRRLSELVGESPARPSGRMRGAGSGIPASENGTGTRGLRGNRRNKRGDMTQVRAILDVLPPDRGLTVYEVIELVRSRHKMEIGKPSAGTTLSHLKRTGQIAHDSTGWRAAASPASDTEVAEADPVGASESEPAEVT